MATSKRKKANPAAAADTESLAKLKRAARNKRPPKPKQTEPRGSRKPKVKKRGPGLAARH